MRPSGRICILVAGLLAVVFFGGCHATCEQSCKKLLECEDVDNARISQSECEAACGDENDLYADWGNPDLEDAFQDELDCIVDSTCEEVVVGACYDETLSIY